ncbi:MAG: hypothetical protein Q7V88_17295 [Actinomycetota bacterium]|nr:hypothetical protein [Actinomycetota bacterium]
MIVCSVLPLAAALHGRDATATIVDSLRPTLVAARAHLVDSVSAAGHDTPLALLVVTGGTEQALLDAWHERQRDVPGEPMLLLVHPAHNSLPAALEALAALQRTGGRGRIQMLPVVALGAAMDGGAAALDPHSPAVAELSAAIHDISVWHAMRDARVGVLGAPSDWLVASVPDAAALRRRWGPTIIDADLPEALSRFEENIDAPIAVTVRVGAKPSAGEPHPADVETAARFEPVLRSIVAEQRLDAVTVRCFDLVRDAYTSGCLALSSLNDRGIVAGCEGDIASTVALLWAKRLTGHIGWMANPATADRHTGVIELAHCTVPLSLVEGYELATHFESGIGVGIAGTLPAGPVTLLRLGGDELQHLWCVDGEALPTVPRAGRCRTQLDVHVAPEAVGELLDRPLGNHLVTLAGHHAQHLRRWWHDLIADS